MTRCLLAALMSAAFCLPFFVEARADIATPNVHVFSCQVLSGTGIVPLGDEIGLAVRFENMSSDTLHSIVWRAKYGSTWIDFIDDGEFSPQTRIDNFLLFEAGRRTFNVVGAIGGNAWNAPEIFEQYASYPDPENCTISRATASDGTLWVNPSTIDIQPFVFPSPTPTPSPAATPAPFLSGAVTVSDCEFNVASDGYLTVRFVNTGDKPMTRVVFRVPYKSGAIDFVDRGNFAPGALVKHSLHTALPHEFFWTLYVPFEQELSHCAVAQVAYADGTAWQNPTAAAAQPPPAPPADALPAQAFLGGRTHWQLHSFPTPVPSATPTGGGA